MAEEPGNKDQQGVAAPEKHEYSEAVKSKARQWFKKARECADRREYDYSIECFLTGLNFWPEAVEEGHMPLRAIGFARAQVGGKKAGMMEALKKPMAGKDAKQAMLNAELLLSKDPGNGSYTDGMLKNALKAGFLETVKWIAPIAFDTMKKDKKPSAGRFKFYRQTLEQAAEQADAVGRPDLAIWFYEHAVNSLDYLVARNPADMALKDEQRNLSGKLTISRGKYGEAESFRDSLQDADKQKILHDTDRAKQADESVEAIVAAARRDLAENPTVPQKVNALVDALLRRERKAEEDEAVGILQKAYEASSNYSFKVRADDIRLRQLDRTRRAAEEQARADGSDESKTQARLALAEYLETQIAVFGERCQKYPTDLRAKYRYGSALALAKRFDDAIPVLQAAQAEPKYRTRTQLLIGQCFFHKQNYADAAAVLKEALDAYELSGDEIHKNLMYWLARSYEEDGIVDEAASTYGKLVRLDYNFAGGDARKRLDALKSGQRKSDT